MSSLAGRIFLIIIMGALFVVLPATASSATIWYVNDNDTNGDVWCTAVGNDGNSGSATNQPKLTIAAALALALANDTIQIDVGTYAETPSISTSDLTLLGADAATTIIDPGDSITISVYGITVSGCNGVTVRNLTVRNANNGVMLKSSSSGTTLSGNRILGNVIGVQLNVSNDNRIVNNLIANNSETGIYVTDNSSNNLFAQNQISGNGDYAIRISATGSCLADTFEKNVIVGNAINGVFNEQGVTYDFGRNWWGSTDSAVIAQNLLNTGGGWLEYTPWRLGAVDTAAGGDSIAPAAPTWMAVAFLTSSSCSISWTPAATNEEVGGALSDLAGYRVYRSLTADTNYWALVSDPGLTTGYTDTGLAPNTTYYYRITAYDNHIPWENESWYGDVVVFDPPPGGVAIGLQGGGETTASQSITLALSTTDDTTAVVYRVSEFLDFTGASWDSWPVGSAVAFTLSAGGETKAVRLQVRDYAGNIAGDTDFIWLEALPNPAANFNGAALTGDQLRLIWDTTPSVYSDTLGAYRYAYSLYWDSGTGTVDYAAPWAAFDTGTTGYDTGPFVSGVTYRFHLVVGNDAGDTDQNSSVLAAVTTLGDTGPRPFYATIRRPRSGRRVAGTRVMVMAELAGSPAGVSITFEYRPEGGAWSAISAARPNNAADTNPDDAFPWFVHWGIDDLPYGNYDLRAVAGDGANTDASPAAITITHDTQNPDVHEEINGDGDHEKKEKVAGQAAVESEVGDTSGVYGIEIPAGQVSASTTLTMWIITDTAAVMNNAGNRNFDTGSEVMELTLDNGQVDFGDTLTIAVPYRDNNSDSVIDGTRVRLSVVQLLYYSSTDDTWHAVARENTHVDAATRTIFGYVTHLSKFAAGKEYLGGDLGLDGEGIPDGDVDANDLRAFNGAFGSGGAYDENADIVTTGTSEGRIDEEDLFAVGRTYGTQ